MVASDGFVVLGAGLPRTGTMSLKTALEKLLGGMCHHGSRVVKYGNKRQADFWTSMLNAHDKGEAIDPEVWREFLSEYRAAVDYPAALFWKVN